MNRRLGGCAFALVLALLAGCGQKGPLYLPQSAQIRSASMVGVSGSSAHEILDASSLVFEEGIPMHLAMLGKADGKRAGKTRSVEDR